MPDATAAVFPDALTQTTPLVVVLKARKYCVLAGIDHLRRNNARRTDAPSSRET
jgi:hypothetical protein